MTVLLIDGSNLMWRSLFGGDQELARASDGALTAAALNFVKSLSALLVKFKPELAGIAFDGPGPSFRQLMAPSYKGNRERTEMTEDQLRQVAWMRHFCTRVGIEVIDSSPYEADDVLATWAHIYAHNKDRVVVASDDKDLQCLCVDGLVTIHLFRDGSMVDTKVAQERWGVPAAQVSDLLAMAGDAVDGHDGVPGMGLKSAAAVLENHGSVEKALIAGPAMKGFSWKRVRAVSPRMLSMAAVTRPVECSGIRAPSRVDANWKMHTAAMLSALEAYQGLTTFCRVHRVHLHSVTPDPAVASASRMKRKVVESGRRLFR